MEDWEKKIDRQAKAWFEQQIAEINEVEALYQKYFKIMHEAGFENVKITICKPEERNKGQWVGEI